MKVKLYGNLVENDASSYDIVANKLVVILNGLPFELKNKIMKNPCYFVLQNEGKDDYFPVDPELLGIDMSNYDTLHITPSVEGEAPAFLIAAFVALGASTATATVLATVVITTIVSIALGGIAMLIMGSPTMNSDQTASDAAKRKSFLFNGAINTTEQGGSVPLVYGFTRCGSTVISAGIDTVTNSTGKWSWAV